MPSHFLFSDQFNDPFIVLRPVREGAVRACLDPSAVLFYECGISRTVFDVIERTVAEEAVDLINALMAWIEPAFRIRKEPV